MNTAHNSPRLASVDAYRGLVMVLMLAEVLEFCHVAEQLPNSPLWRFLCSQQSHVEWVGCSIHDLIQPSFSFLVGVALPFSIASRMAKGQSTLAMGCHALWRSIVLIGLGIFLRSMGRSRTNFTFEDTLTQIGLGYSFLFLLAFRPRYQQWLAFGLILGLYWLAFVLYPLPAPDFSYRDVGVPADWGHLADGFASHWNKNSNLAWDFDTWFLNLFPRESPFQFNGGGYATLSFIPTLATMLLGLLAGETLRRPDESWRQLRWLVTVGCLVILGGWLLHRLGLCPLVKRIWTPSFALYSGGWCCWILAWFYAVLDVGGHRRWAFPLIVVGMNSIAVYVMSWTLKSFISEQLVTHLGTTPFRMFGTAYEPLVLGLATLFVIWLIAYWMYRRRIFLRI